MNLIWSLPYVLPSLILSYAFSEVVHYRFFKHIKHWRTWAHILLITGSGLFFLSLYSHIN